MHNVHPFLAQDKRYEDASLWVAKIDRGLSSDEKRSLSEWLSENDANRDVLFGMAKQWDKMDSLARLSRVFPENAGRQVRPSRLALAVAAAAILAVASMLIIIELRQGVGLENAVSGPTDIIYETTIGEQSLTVLPDGTEVRLNTNTLLRVAYFDHQRLLTLERGELNVRVAHDPLRPLSVIANDRVIRAVGTEFNIEITTDQRIELVVTDGTVIVGMLEQGTLGTVVDSSSVSVSGGEEIVLGSSDEELRTIEPAEIEVKLSWRDGNLLFRGESLEDAMAEVGRYTAIEFIFLDEEAKRVRVAGLFKAGDVNGLLSALRENFDITYARVGNDRILLSGK